MRNKAASASSRAAHLEGLHAEEAGHRQNVIGRRPMRKKSGRLNHIANAAPEFFRVHCPNVMAIDFDLPFVWDNHRIDHAQHRRLAASRRAGKDEKCATFNSERQIRRPPARRRNSSTRRAIRSSPSPCQAKQRFKDKVRRKRQQNDRDRTRQDKIERILSNALKDEGAKPSRADQGGDAGQADRLDRHDPQPGDRARAGRAAIRPR